MRENSVKKHVADKLHNISFRYQLLQVFILTSLIIFAVNIFIFVNINQRMAAIDDVYSSNTQNNELSETLDMVQETMTDYLLTKSTDTMESYYKSVSNLEEMLENVDDTITGYAADILRKDIKNMTYTYLELADETIQNKRGRDVEKYRATYEEATALHEYISSYIYSLNNEQFKQNTTNYQALLVSMNLLEVISFSALGLVTIVGMLLTYFLTGRITKPLTVLARNAYQVALGNFSVEIPERDSKDEIGILTKAFNRMIISIKDYIEKVKISVAKERDLKEKELKMEAQLKEAQLKYFQAQVNPHFLFNTLNAGAQLAMMEGADKTYEFVNNVAEFFRYNIKKDNAITTLKDELQLVDYYVYILNVRFSNEIQMIKDIDETLTNRFMPSMILQPIVENCINYGIRDIDREGRIYLTVYKTGEEILVSIADNGIGMEQEKIASILEGKYTPDENHGDSNGVGLENVISRLKMFYGTENVIEIISEGKEQGTEVILHIPEMVEAENIKSEQME